MVIESYGILWEMLPPPGDVGVETIIVKNKCSYIYLH